MTSKLPVLVTGAGGVYGEATVANLRQSSLPVHVLGADTRWHAPGVLCSDEPAVLPRVDDPDYVPRLKEVVGKSGAKAVFVCSGTEMQALLDRRDELERDTGAVFILPGAALYRMASDKLDTVSFLVSKGFDHPLTIPSGDEVSLTAFVDRVGFPIVAKPRRGQGSRGLALCRSIEDLQRIQALDEEYVFQEHLGDDDHEYTVGVVATEAREVLGSIVLRRWLAGGQTGACEVVHAPVISDYAEALAKELMPRGYVNIQLRMRNGRPVAFEINARVSSSTGFRALAGFNEPELILRKYVLGETPPRPNPSTIAMVRGLAVRIVDPAVWRRAAPSG